MNPASELRRSARTKILTRPELLQRIRDLRLEGRSLVFTNGCFDLIHPGHVRYLEAARQMGDILIVAVNSDASVQRLKGAERPVQSETDRAEVLASLETVDCVTVFDEDTPQLIIDMIQPDVLVKGGDWVKEEIVGRDTVERRGGQVVAIQFEPGYSTTAIIERIKSGAGRSSASSAP